MKYKLLLFVLLIASSFNAFAHDQGFYFFTGYGVDVGPTNYKNDRDKAGAKFHDENQINYGFEYTYKFSNVFYIRGQYLHSSGADNGTQSSYSDTNMTSIHVMVNLSQGIKRLFQ